MTKFYLYIVLLLTLVTRFNAQTQLYRDTITVFENGTSLKNPWAGGLNFCAFSALDVNLDGKKDIVVYDKVYSQINRGKFKVFLNKGGVGQINYIHAPEYQDKFPEVNDWALFFDYNNDGQEDLFTYTTGGIKVFRNTSISTNDLSFVLEKSLLYSTYYPNTSPQISNLYCNAVALPGIADMDGDGDLDVLSYSVFGVQMEYHKNMSKELYNNTDSLVFHMVDDCWGDIKETNCEVYLSQCPIMIAYNDIIGGNSTQKIQHAGSCIMCFDRDSDGDMDALLGDISCNHVSYVDNCGSSSNAHICDTTKQFPNFGTNMSTTAIKLNTFPCTHYLDINNDGVKDLIASPNATAGAENYKSVWLYKNNSTNGIADFQFVQTNFLQDNMLECGEGSYPIVVDYNVDGKLDLLIANTGYYTTNTNISKMALYENTGTTIAPTFSLITRDFASLSSFTISNMYPTFGDLDADGDMDMIVGDGIGKLHYFENIAGANNTFIFNSPVSDYESIDIGNVATPQLIDVNRDGLLDLLVGASNGKLAYFKNTGTSTLAKYTLQTMAFGGVDVRPSGLITGYSVPYLYDDGGVYKLLVGSEGGNLFLYTNIDNNLLGTFTKADDNLLNLYEGARSAPVFVDLNGDNQRDLIVGNYAGGLVFYNSINPVGINDVVKLHADDIVVYPNPAEDVCKISFKNNYFNDYTLVMYDALGKEVYHIMSNSKELELPIYELKKGFYVLKITGKTTSYSISKKLIIN